MLPLCPRWWRPSARWCAAICSTACSSRAPCLCIRRGASRNDAVEPIYLSFGPFLLPLFFLVTTVQVTERPLQCALVFCRGFMVGAFELRVAYVDSTMFAPVFRRRFPIFGHVCEGRGIRRSVLEVVNRSDEEIVSSLMNTTPTSVVAGHRGGVVRELP